MGAIRRGGKAFPLVFKDSPTDFRPVIFRGRISSKIGNLKLWAEGWAFMGKEMGKSRKKETEKLTRGLTKEAQPATSSYIHSIKLKESIRSAKAIEEKILAGLKSSQAIGMLGIEILGANILAIQASPEMARALETETREKLQQEADQAIYERRNFAVEQERKIKESELNTEIAVEEKHKQIAEKKMESDVQKAENDRKLRELKVQADISVENQRKLLIEQKNLNDKKDADTKGYVIETTLKPYRDIDWKTLTALNNNSDPKFNISLAFRQLAENADKIGNLNISPDLLDSLLNEKKDTRK